ESGDQALKDRLLTYNLEGCDALRMVAEFLYSACLRPETGGVARASADEVADVEELKPVSSRREWCKIDLAIADLDFVNERAYYDYLRDRVYVRTSETIRKAQAQERRKKGRKDLRANRSVEIEAGTCPFCGGMELTRKPDGRLYRLA